MISYKKARRLSDLLVNQNHDTVFLRHKENVDDGICPISISNYETMTGRQLLKKFNDHINAILDDIRNDQPVEIPEGQPQLKWNEECQFWQSTGDVLRCIVDWDSPGDPDGQACVRIDDKELSGEQFMELLAVYEGWGMRVEFMHPNRLASPPKPKLKQS